MSLGIGGGDGDADGDVTAVMIKCLIIAIMSSVIRAMMMFLRMMY